MGVKKPALGGLVVGWVGSGHGLNLQALLTTGLKFGSVVFIGALHTPRVGLNKCGSIASEKEIWIDPIKALSARIDEAIFEKLMKPSPESSVAQIDLQARQAAIKKVEVD